MGDLDLLLQSVVALHETCFDDSQWTSALVSVGRLLRSFTVTVALESRALNFPFIKSFGLSNEAINDYAVEYSRIDPVIAHVRNAPMGIAYTDKMAIDETSFAKTRFASDFAGRYGMRPCLQAFTDRNEFSSGFVCAARSTTGGEFTAADRDLTHALLPHLRQVLQVRRLLQRLEGERLTALDMLNRLDRGAILVDEDFRVVFANREGDRLLTTASGISTKAGCLIAATAADTTRLRRSIRHSTNLSFDRDPSPVIVKRLPPLLPLMLQVVPLRAPATENFTKARDLIFILVSDPDWNGNNVAIDLGPVFDFTPTEARVALLLADGKSPAVIAATMKVSIATVRTHLAHIFDKSGTSRQSELVAAIGRYRR